MSDAYDFYPCLVDGAPASIYVNLSAARDHAGDDTLYTIAIALRDRGEHGIGTAEETAALDSVEGAVIDRATELAVMYVGRLRTAGIWEIVLYGSAGHLEALQVIAQTSDRVVTARSHPDRTWAYYRELLLPDAERLQWMDDRRMVQILAEQGDRLVTPRRVDHRLAFATVAALDSFAREATTQGFAVASTDELGGVERSHRIQLHRLDPIELDHIHEVVMLLVDAASAYGGRYERWEAGIV